MQVGRHKLRFWTMTAAGRAGAQQLRRATLQCMAQMAAHQWIFVYHSLQHGRICQREENRTEFNCMQR